MPPDLSNPWDWIQLIFTALGLSTTAGLRAYLPLLAVALGSTDPSLTHIELTPGFQWMGTQWFMIIIGALALIEFGVDKAPGLDHVNDIVPTIIRPASGAIIMAGIVNPISAWNPWVAAVIGGVLALIMHGIKSATRPAVTATTVGVGNPLVSIGEDIGQDIGALITTILAIFLPIIGVIVLVVALPLCAPLRAWIYEALRAGRHPSPDQRLGVSVIFLLHPEHASPQERTSAPVFTDLCDGFAMSDGLAQLCADVTLLYTRSSLIATGAFANGYLGVGDVRRGAHADGFARFARFARRIPRHCCSGTSPPAGYLAASLRGWPW